MIAKSWVKLYWEQNEDWLKVYFTSFNSFCGCAGLYTKNYGLTPIIIINGFKGN